MRFFRIFAGATLAAALCWAAFANAQVAGADDQPEPDNPQPAQAANANAPTGPLDDSEGSRAIDEITVTAGPHGETPFELEVARQAKMKEVVFADMRFRERAEEELAWREADRDLNNPESRIKWGYSPQAEQRMRRELDAMNDLPIDRTKPATLFRVEF